MNTVPAVTPTEAPKVAGNLTVPAGHAMCVHCQKTWGGMSTCHCAGCHRTFAGITAFDAHRKGGTCHTPEVVGLERNDRSYECYGSPAERPQHWN